MTDLPKVVVHRARLKKNLEVLGQRLNDAGIQVAGVTKVFGAYPEITELYDQADNIQYLADSRIENFANYPPNTEKPKMLLRIPMISQVAKVVAHADISLNSEIETIQALNEAATQANTTHQIILMIDLGDLREGIFDQEELLTTVGQIQELNNIELIGIGTNLTCYGAIIPTPEVLDKLVSFKELIEERYNIELHLISGGNSSSIYLLDEEQPGIPPGINMLRIGEALVLGRETAYGDKIYGMHEDAFVLEAEIVEYKEKPSYPIGPIGMNAFGEKVQFEDKGPMQRGIIALGKQDVDFSNLIPIDERIEILGASSDHMIIDFTRAKADYALGSKVQFLLTYGSLLSVFTSKYVNKEII